MLTQEAAALRQNSPARPTVRAEAEKVQAQIRTVLDRFAQAYGAESETALTAVWPSGAQAFRNEFRTFESLSWVFGACGIDVADATATATCPVTIKRVDSRSRREVSETGRRQFILRNQAGNWRIDTMMQLK